MFSVIFSAKKQQYFFFAGKYQIYYTLAGEYMYMHIIQLSTSMR